MSYTFSALTLPLSQVQIREHKQVLLEAEARISRLTIDLSNCESKLVAANERAEDKKKFYGDGMSEQQHLYEIQIEQLQQEIKTLHSTIEEVRSKHREMEHETSIVVDSKTR